jgi:nucleotide-binding universal stress UspA family protein
MLIVVDEDADVETAVSTNSGQAISWGHLLAQLTDSVPTLLTVVKSESDRSHGQVLLNHAVQMLAGSTAVPPKIVAVGRAADEVVGKAAAGQYDLLVIGTWQFPSFIERILGSATDQILQQAPCPVLIAKSNPNGLRRILICEGGRKPSLLHRFIIQLPDLINAASEIKILHVMSQILANPAETGWELQADADELIEQQSPEGDLLLQDVQLLTDVPAPIETEVRHGLVVDEIVAETKNGLYDLIVIGQHEGGSWWLADLMGQIVTQVDRSVLVI